MRLVLPRAWGGGMTWSMFQTASSHDRRLIARVYAPDGTTSDLPISTVHTYHRGFTRETVADDSRHRKWATPQQWSDYAQWVARRLTHDGREIQRLDLIRIRKHLRTGRSKRKLLATFASTDPPK